MTRITTREKSVMNRPGLWAVALLVCAASVGAVHADTSLNKLGFDMTWNDEFGGTNVNLSKWSVENYGTPANNELQYYTPDCVYVENDVLVIKSDRNADPGRYSGREFISGKLTTAGRYAQQYGYWEVRAWLPEGIGLWPAHWMLGYNGWPPEIDVTEMIGNVPNHMTMSVHWGPIYGDEKPWEIGQTGGGEYWHWESMCWSYHVFAMEWNWWGVKFYIDGVERASCYKGCPKEPMFFILNTAVGGDWPGYPWGTTFPKYHIVDYVRVWQHCDGRSLLDPGFEEGDDDRFPDWNAYDNGNVVRDDNPLHARSGAGAAQIYGRFTGVDNASGLYQDLYAYPGETFEGSFWVRNRPGDALAGTNTAQMKIEFLDADEALLSRRAFTMADSNGPASYTEFALRDVAPTGTARARLVVELNQRGDASGSINVDDAEFFVVTPFTYRPLLNGGFEIVHTNDFANWWKTGENVVAESAPTNVHEGVRAVRFYEESSGSPDLHALHQDIPARAGETWIANVRARPRVGEPLTGSSAGFLRLEFVNAVGGVLSSSQVATVTSSSPAEYTNYVAEALAPAQTAFARIVLGLWQDGAGGGAMICDAADLAPLVTNETPQLINSDFELYDGTNYSSWTWYSGISWNTQNDTNHAYARSGTNAVWLFGQYPAGLENNYSGIFQDLPAAQGEVWEVSAWARNRPNDGLQGSNAARLKIEFLNAAKTRIDYDQFSIITSNSPEYYQQVVMRRVAPTNAEFARVVLELKQVNNADGSVNFDDAALRLLTVQDDRTLVNGDFELGEEGKFLNWSEWGNVLPNIVHEDQATNILGGSNAAKIFGQFSGSYNECGLFQDVPVASGEMWLASVWAKNRRGDALTGGNRARLKLEYLTSAGSALGTNALTILDSSSSDDVWQYFAIRHLVPDGASRARIVLQMNQTNSAGGAVNFDNAAMRVVTDSDSERSILEGGFEEGIESEFASWDRYGYAGITNIFRDPVSAHARSGSVALQMHGSYHGATNDSGIYQNIPAKSGELWEASVWARNRPGDAITSNNQAVLKLEFVDEENAIIQARTLEILNRASSTNYQQFVLRDRAPDGTRLARIVVQFNQYDYMPGSMNLDDVGFRVITAADGDDVANGDLDAFSASGFLNWSAYGDGNHNVIRDPATNTLSGAGALQVFGEYSGALTFSGLYQGVPCQEGQIWKAVVWARNRPGDALQGNNQARLKLDFLSSTGSIIGSLVMPVVDASSSTNYRQNALIAEAPANAAEARIVLELMQQNWQGGSANFDRASIEVLPELAGTQDVQRVMLAGPLSPGRLDSVHFTGDLILNSTSDLLMEIGGTNGSPRWDRFEVGGTCTVDGVLNVSLVTAFPPYIPRKGDRLELIRAAGVSGTFDSLNGPTAVGGAAAFSIASTATNVSLVVAGELDTDSDSLPDHWEQQYFNSALGASTTLDADNDRMDNLGEYISDTVPTNAASCFRIEALNRTNSFGVAFSCTNSRVYSLEYRSSLVTDDWSLVTGPSTGEATGVMYFIDPANAAWRFYSIGVRLP